MLYLKRKFINYQSLKRSLSCLLLLLMINVVIAACASSNDKTLEVESWPADKIYHTAYQNLIDSNYSKAIKLYNTLIITYPYGKYAKQGLLDLAYSYYKNDKTELALATINQYINVYASSDNIDYALYFKGIINYNELDSFISIYTKQDASELEPLGLQEAYSTFHQLIIKYPNSKFTNDAIIKSNIIVNKLARGQLQIIKYYFSIKAYLAAINRAQNLITTYIGTQYVEEALAIEIASYKQLGLVDLSYSTTNILRLNYPHSKYLLHDWVNQSNEWYKIF